MSSRIRHLHRVAALARGAAILWAFLLLGGAAVRLFGLPVPGSVAAMVLLWTALEAGLVPLRWVAGAGELLLALLGLLFVPLGAGFVEYLGAGALWLTAAVTGLGVLLVLAVCGHVVQHAMRNA